MPIKTIKRYGWLPDLPDHNDIKYSVPHHLVDNLPSQVDLREKMPAVYDQNALGSCTANGTAAILHYLEMKENKPNVFPPARLPIYYNTRVLEGTVRFDSGASIRNAIKSTVKWGFCDEALFPYDISKFKTKPSSKLYGIMWHHRVAQYQSVPQTLGDLKAVLASGNLFTFGFTVYQSFESAEMEKTGTMQMPKSGEKVLGGHCVTGIGFSDATRRFLCRNSWGSNWGMSGYFTMPYEFITDSSYCDDFWTILAVP